MTRLFELEIKNREISFDVAVSPLLARIEVFADKDRLKQVVINLVSNAIKFCHSAITVECFSGESIKRADNYRVSDIHLHGVQAIECSNQEEAKEPREHFRRVREQHHIISAHE